MSKKYNIYIFNILKVVNNTSAAIENENNMSVNLDGEI